MNTAQTVLTQGAKAQQTAAITGTIPWLALIGLFGLLIYVLIPKRK